MIYEHVVRFLRRGFPCIHAYRPVRIGHQDAYIVPIRQRVQRLRKCIMLIAAYADLFACHRQTAQQHVEALRRAGGKKHALIAYAEQLRYRPAAHGGHVLTAYAAAPRVVQGRQQRFFHRPHDAVGFREAGCGIVEVDHPSTSVKPIICESCLSFSIRLPNTSA